MTWIMLALQEVYSVNNSIESCNYWRTFHLFFDSIIMSRYHDAIKYLHTITNHDTTIIRSRRLRFLMLHCAEFHCLKYAWHYWTCLRHFPRVLVYRTSNPSPLWIPLLFECSDFEVFETSSTSPARPIPNKLHLPGRGYRVPSMTKWINTTGFSQGYAFTIIYPHTKQKATDWMKIIQSIVQKCECSVQRWRRHHQIRPHPIHI